MTVTGSSPPTGHGVVEAERWRHVAVLAEVAVVHSQHPGRTLGPGQLDVIVKIMPDQALEHRPDQLSMATQHGLTYRRVQAGEGHPTGPAEIDVGE
jgi:hypothetical protein